MRNVVESDEFGGCKWVVDNLEIGSRWLIWELVVDYSA